MCDLSDLDSEPRHVHDYFVYFIQGEGQTFDYPNLESKIPNLVEKVQEGADKEDERIKEKVKNTAYVPNWFK